MKAVLVQGRAPGVGAAGRAVCVIVGTHVWACAPVTRGRVPWPERRRGSGKSQRRGDREARRGEGCWLHAGTSLIYP